MTVDAPQIFTTPSGLQVIAVCRPTGKSFVASLMYRAGTFDDPPDAPGMAHFAEHLAFTGPSGKLSAQLASLGARANGSTQYDHTEFKTSGHVDDVDTGLEFLNHVVRNRSLTQADIDREKRVFRHELESDDPRSSGEENIDRFWRRNLGDPNWRSCQTKDSVKIERFTAERANSFKSRFYQPANARLAIVSPLAFDDIRERCLRSLPSEPLETSPPNVELNRPIPTNRPLTFKWDSSKYIWVDVFHTLPVTTPYMRFAADIVSRLLGGGQHSEMFRELRTKRSLTYHAYADDWPYLHCTAMHCFFSVTRRALKDALTFVLERLDHFATKGVTESQLKSEIQRMIRWHEMSMESPHRLASYLAYEALRSDSVEFSANGYTNASKSLTCEQVNQAAAQLLMKKNRVTFVGGAAGPISWLRVKRILASR